jgi:hypothetical protein
MIFITSESITGNYGKQEISYKMISITKFVFLLHLSGVTLAWEM